MYSTVFVRARACVNRKKIVLFISARRTVPRSVVFFLLLEMTVYFFLFFYSLFLFIQYYTGTSLLRENLPSLSLHRSSISTLDAPLSTPREVLCLQYEPKGERRIGPGALPAADQYMLLLLLLYTCVRENCGLLIRSRAHVKRKTTATSSPARAYVIHRYGPCTSRCEYTRYTITTCMHTHDIISLHCTGIPCSRRSCPSDDD